MTKLFYNVYSNISDRKYLAFEKKLNLLQYKMSKTLFHFNWRLPDPLSKKDGLYISFMKHEKMFDGAIAMVFDDQPNNLTFSFGVSKGFDENKIRYAIQNNLAEHKEIGFFEENLDELTESALRIYNDWSKEDVITLGEKVALS